MALLTLITEEFEHLDVQTYLKTAKCVDQNGKFVLDLCYLSLIVLIQRIL